MISVFVEILVLKLCFMEITIGDTHPKYKPPNECPRILGWNENYASTHHLKIPLPLVLRVSGSLYVPLMYHIICTNLPQSSLSGTCTLVVINMMSVQVSVLYLLVEYKVFDTILWNSMTFS